MTHYSELKLDDTSLRIAVGLRLGLQIVTPHNCNGCNQLVDPWGRHGLSCLKNVKGTHARHNVQVQVHISNKTSKWAFVAFGENEI